MPAWAWLLIAVGGLLAVSCIGCGGAFFWLGASSPNTSVYAGNEVPAAYLQTAQNLGALDPGEKVLWFYSDGVAGIESGFYLVTDQRVSIYREGVGQPLTVIPFDQIRGVDLDRETSFFIDSSITLELTDGSVVAFPVSSELDRDVRFLNAIEERIQP